MSQIVNIPPKKLEESSSGFQSRATTDLRVVSDYCDLIKDAVGDWIFPPVTAFQAPDSTEVWLVDGFHRVRAAIKAGLDTVPVSIHVGTKREALLYALGANGSHGLQRNHLDKRNAVRLMLTDSEWVCWSDREIARRTVTSPSFVSTMRAELVAAGKIKSSPHRTYQRDGRTQYMTPAPTTRVPLVDEAVLSEEDEPRLRQKSDRNTCPSCGKCHSSYVPIMGYKWMCMLCKSVSTDQHLSDGVWVEEPKTPRHWGLQAKVDATARQARAEAEAEQAKANAAAIAALATPPPDSAPVIDNGKTGLYTFRLKSILKLVEDAKPYAQTIKESNLLHQINALITMSTLLSDNLDYHE